MEFFKRKSLLAMAAAFAVLFASTFVITGCGGGGGGGEDDSTDNKEPGEWPNDLLFSYWLDADLTFKPMDGSMGCGAWYYHYEYGEITNAAIKVGEVSWKARLDWEDEDNDIWPYASMNVAIDTDVLMDDFEIHLTYSSSEKIRLVLNDVYEFSNGKQAGNEGVCYAAALAKGDNLSVILKKANFKQPTWAAGDGLGYTLDTKKVEGFGFDAGNNYGGEVTVKVTKMIVDGLDWGED